MKQCLMSYIIYPRCLGFEDHLWEIIWLPYFEGLWPLTLPLRSNGLIDHFNTVYLLHYWSYRFGMSKELLGNQMPLMCFLWVKI